MMFTTEMIQLFAVVLGKDSQRVTEALLREGCMQFVRSTELEGLKDLSAVELSFVKGVCSSYAAQNSKV